MPLQINLMFAVVALLIGFSKGGLGGPVPVALTAPLLSLVIPPRTAVGVILPLLMFADVFALYFYWRRWEIRYVRLMLPAGVIGVILGTLLLATLSNETLRRIIGAFTLIAVIYKVLNDRLKSVTYRPQDWHAYLAGWGSGFGSSLANAGAPPFTAYMLLQPGMTPIPFIGTTTLFFAVINVLKLPGFLSTGVLDVDLLLRILWVLPLIPFGVWLGQTVVARMDTRVFESMMLAALFLMGLALLFT